MGKPDCLRRLTKIGNTITPTVKRQIGATTINIDSRDMNNFGLINKFKIIHVPRIYVDGSCSNLSFYCRSSYFTYFSQAT